MTAYLLRKRLSGEKIFPLVLMLEPLHACNLRCTGCGRIREYADTMHRRLSIDQCLAAVAECGSPIVSVCGGEPLIYPEIEVLIESLVMQRKHVYLCTNGLALGKKAASGLRPSSRLFINVHIDGMEATHDRMVEHQGVFCCGHARHHRGQEGRDSRSAPTRPIYRDTDMHEIAVLFDYLYELGRRRVHDFAGVRLYVGPRIRPAGWLDDFHDPSRGTREVSDGRAALAAVPVDGLADLHGVFAW